MDGSRGSLVPQAAVDLIKRFEGFRANAYVCPGGHWTAGYGTRRGVTPTTHVTEDEAEQMLMRDLEMLARGVRALLKVPLTDSQFGALVSFAYNLGLGALANSTLIRKVNAGNLDGAREEFGRWVNAGGKRLDGLVRRRAAEAEMWGA